MQTEMIQPQDDDIYRLPVGATLLREQYVIEGQLVSGGFGNTYIARDSLDRQVVIKECFVEQICIRHKNNVHASSSENQTQFAHIRKHFLREARRMARLNHQNIVGVHQVFEENNTAYMALDHVVGMDLQTVIESHNERLTPQTVRSVLLRCLDAIGYVHSQDLLHGDISPDNLMLDDAGNVTLIDFGSSHEQKTPHGVAVSRIVSVKDGYSPQEFYSTEEQHSPASDLYALGATFYHVITGVTPDASLTRLKAVASEGKDSYRPLAGNVPGYDDTFLAAIDTALSLYPEDRMQSAQDWLDIMGSWQGTPVNLPVGDTAAAPAIADNDFLRVISELVAEVNGDLEPAETMRDALLAVGQANAAALQQKLVAAAEGQDEEPAQLVDMFGNPIENVDRWLEDQTRQSAKRMTRLAATPQPNGQSTQNTRRKSQGLRAVSALLSRLGFGASEKTTTKTYC